MDKVECGMCNQRRLGYQVTPPQKRDGLLKPPRKLREEQQAATGRRRMSGEAASKYDSC